MRPGTVLLGLAGLALAAFVVAVPRWTHPPIGGHALAPQPAAMIQFDRGQMEEPVPQTAPQPLPAAARGGPLASEAYRDVQVLTDLSQAEFLRLQEAMVQWVAPQQGCAFCHAGQDFASDAKPQKAVARAMLKMVRHINEDWAEHVGPSGVTCFTCHRGQAVPAETWFPSTPAPERPFVARQESWRESADNVRKFFPDAGSDLYLLEDTPISVQSSTALPSQTVATQVVAKRVYEMMMQMSDGIGVNCGFCHESRALADWKQSTPHRWRGHSGLKLTRDLNRDTMLPLFPLMPLLRVRTDETEPSMLPAVLPAHETGPQPGNGLIQCATCHEARPKPLEGAPMLADYPGLGRLPAKAAAPKETAP